MKYQIPQSASPGIKDNRNISLLRRLETYRGADIPPHYDHNRINFPIPAKRDEKDPAAPSEYLKIGLFGALYQCSTKICLEKPLQKNSDLSLRSPRLPSFCGVLIENGNARRVNLHAVLYPECSC